MEQFSHINTEVEAPEQATTPASTFLIQMLRPSH